MSSDFVRRSSRRVRAVSLALALVFGAVGVASGGVYLGSYLQTDGTSYIDTGVIAETNMVADYWVYFNGERWNIGAFLGASSNASTSNFYLGGYQGGSGIYVANGSRPSTNYDPYFLNQCWQHVVVTASVDRLTVHVDGHECGPYTMPSPKPAGISLYCFCNNVQGAVNSHMPSGSRIGALKLWKNDVLVRDFTPATESDVVGFRDAVSGNFFAPPAGTFTRGGSDGDVVQLATADAAAAATTSFNGAGGWASGAAPDADHDYVVALGEDAGLWLPTAAATFAGQSLQIGSDAAKGRLNASTTANYTGAFTWRSGVLDVSANVTPNFVGVVRVTSTAAEPFVIQGAKGAVYVDQSSCDVSGDETAVIVVKGTGTANDFVFGGSGWSAFRGSQYSGKIVLDGARFRVANLNLGHRTFMKDAITLRNGSAMTSNSYLPVWNVPNAGIWIEETGGKYYSECAHIDCYQTIQGGPFTTAAEMRFYGTMRVSKLTVADRASKNLKSAMIFKSAATIDIPEIDVTGGDLSFESGVTCENDTKTAVTVTSGTVQADNFPSDYADLTLAGGQIYMTASSGVVALTNLAYTAGSVKISFDSTAVAAQCLRLCGTVAGVSASNKLKLTGDAWPATVATGKYPVLRIEKTAVDSLSADMIDIDGFVYDDPTYQIALSVEESGDDYVVSFSRKFAQGIELVKGDTAYGTVTAFNGNPDNNWSDGLAPHAAQYVVALGASEGLYLPTTAATFAGLQLTIGDDSAAGLLSAETAADWTIASLILKKGTWDIAKPCALSKISKLTVESTAADPFQIRLGGNGFKLATDNCVYGEEDAVLVISRLSGTTLYSFTGNSAPFGDNYKGKLVFDGVEGDISGTKFNASFANASDFAADRITLKNYGGIAQYGWGSTDAVFNNAKVGITVDATGGTIFQPTQSFPSWYVPIVGGPLKCNGAKFCARLAVSDLAIASLANQSRKVVFGAESTIAVDNVSVTGVYWATSPTYSGTANLFVGGGTYEKTIPVTVAGATESSVYGQGYLYLPASASTNFKVTLSPGGHICPNDAASCESGTVGTSAESIVLKDLVNAGGDILLKYDATADEVDSVELSGTVTGVSAETPLKFTGSNLPSTAFAGEYPALQVPTSVMTLTKDMIDISGVTFDDPAVIIDGEVKTVGDKQILYVRQKTPEAITLVEGDGEIAEMTAFNGHAERWSDNLVPHDGPYVVAKGTNVTDALFLPSTSTVSFAGSKLSIGDVEKGAGRLDARVKTECTVRSLEFVDGLLYIGGSQVKFANSISIVSTVAKPFEITGAASASLLVAFEGESDAAFVVRGPESGLFEYQAGLSWGNNGIKDYAGRIILDGNVRMVIGGLSSAHESFVADAIRLRNNATLTTTSANPTLQASNVGVTVEETGGRLTCGYETHNGWMSLALAGGPFTFDYTFNKTSSTLNYTGSAALSALNVKSGTINMKSGATMSNETYAVTGGVLTFDEGVTFANKTVAPMTVTNGTVCAGAAAAAALSFDLKSDGTLSVTNSGAVCQTLATTDLKLAGGATVRLDVDPTALTCDALVSTGAGTQFTASRQNRLNIVVNPLNGLGETDDVSRTFTLLTLPATAGDISRRAFALTTTQASVLDRLRLRIARDGATVKVLLTDHSDGLAVIVR